MENMFRLESGPVGGIVGSTMLMAVVERLLDLDVSVLELHPCFRLLRDLITFC